MPEIRSITITDAQGKVVTFQVAPTPIAKLARCRAFIAKKEMDTPEAIEALIEAFFWGARRAKSEITLEWLLTNVDQHNMGEVFKLFTELNLPKRVEPGEEEPTGEARAANVTPLRS